jgi:hypothetical protein
MINYCGRGTYILSLDEVVSTLSLDVVSTLSLDEVVSTLSLSKPQEISAVFKAVGNSPYAETLGIHVSERDHADSPGGITYEISGINMRTDKHELVMYIDLPRP